MQKKIVYIEINRGSLKIAKVPEGVEIQVFDHEAKKKDPDYDGEIYEHVPEYVYDWTVAAEKKMLDEHGDAALAELKKAKIDLSKLEGFVLHVEKVPKQGASNDKS